jgi:hypothetical protein
MWVGWASTPSLIWAWPTPMAMTAMTMDKNVFFIWLMFLWLEFIFASKLLFSSLCSFKDDAKVGLL